MKTILYFIVLLPVLFIAICFVVTQFMDVYEAISGESWKNRVERLKHAKNESK